jgi:hypothetical protein
MPKSRSGDSDFSGYTPVADRIALFYQRYPTGRIITELHSQSNGAVTFRALAYRGLNDPNPAATGWASEREGDGDINTVACVENTETSAIGRALANLGFTASTRRPSREEMEKTVRERARLVKGAALVSEPAPATSVPVLDADPLQQQANAVHDVLDLLARAEALGFPVGRGERLRTPLLELAPLPPARLARLERRLRGWIALHRFSLG